MRLSELSRGRQSETAVLQSILQHEGHKRARYLLGAGTIDSFKLRGRLQSERLWKLVQRCRVHWAGTNSARPLRASGPCLGDPSARAGRHGSSSARESRASSLASGCSVDMFSVAFVLSFENFKFNIEASQKAVTFTACACGSPSGLELVLTVENRKWKCYPFAASRQKRISFSTPVEIFVEISPQRT